MKAVLLAICTAFLSLSFGQNFTLQDTSFQTGDVMRRDIFFDFTKANIREDSHNKPILDSIGNFLSKHPDLKVEVSYHRDTRDSNVYWIGLTQRRADSILSYMLRNYPIRPEQIKAKGYGDSKPLIPASEINKLPGEEQEKAHQKNRRTEFTIIEILK